LNMSEGGDGDGPTEPSVCALEKPTIRARKRTPAIRGADPKQSTEPHRRAEGRHKREMALTARGRSGFGAPGIEARTEAASAATSQAATNPAGGTCRLSWGSRPQLLSATQSTTIANER
jgi:hypothetical protein